jgi:hypothetical protein
MLVYYIWVWGGVAWATVVCAIACLWGGWPERICGATLWIAWVLSLLVESHGANGPGNQVILIDSICLVVFTALSLKWRHVWTLLVAASQLDDVVSQFAGKTLHYGLWSYIVATGIWGGEFILFCLLFATITRQRRLKRERAHQAA